MELGNRTPFPAGLFRTVIDEERIAASVLVRVTFDLIGEDLFPAAEQGWKVSARPWESEYGPMDSDEVFYKGGIDLFVFGHACAPEGKQTTQVEVAIEAGSARRSAVVFGERVWERSDEGVVPSTPRPFSRIPLTIENAFGGKAKWDGLDVPYPDNPEGKGFFLEEEKAVGHALPNIETPGDLISRWDQRPEPVGFTSCPIQCGLRVRNGIELDDSYQIKTIRPTLFNAAYPWLILDRLSPGDFVRVSGVTPGVPVAFRIPAIGLVARLRFDDEVIEGLLSIDQIGIEVEKQKVFLAYRYPFRYLIYPLQRRSCDLYLRGGATLHPGALPS